MLALPDTLRSKISSHTLKVLLADINWLPTALPLPTPPPRLDFRTALREDSATLIVDLRPTVL